jgi:hypothetical protein
MCFVIKDVLQSSFLLSFCDAWMRQHLGVAVFGECIIVIVRPVRRRPILARHCRIAQLFCPHRTRAQMPPYLFWMD